MKPTPVLSLLAACCLAVLPAIAQQPASPCGSGAKGKASCCSQAGKKKASCCMGSASAQFAMLGEDPSFAEAHAAPLPYAYVPHGGKWITLSCPDGPEGRAFFVKNGMPTDNYLIVVHEWWGLNDYMVEMAERLFHDVANANVLAIDLYDGKTTDMADEAGKLMQARDEQRLQNIVQAALNFAGDKAVIQTIGWCFGGTWSLQTALMAGQRTAGCVVYYGQPEEDTGKLARLSGPLLGIYGDRDDWITPAVVDGFEKNLKKLKKDYAFKRYDAVHAFANPSNPNHNKEYAADAYKAATAFLNRNFSDSGK